MNGKGADARKQKKEQQQWYKDTKGKGKGGKDYALSQTQSHVQPFWNPKKEGKGTKGKDNKGKGKDSRSKQAHSDFTSVKKEGKRKGQ